MSPDKLVYMANQIATFFDSQKNDEAAKGIAAHINDFWEPRMRTQLLDMLGNDEAGFKPSVIAAGALIRPPKPVADAAHALADARPGE